jgi:hypothetical protein
MSTSVKAKTKHWFEVYLLKETTTKQDWNKLLYAISQHMGVMKPWDLVVTTEHNTLRYYIGAPRDVGVLSNNLDGMVLQPVSESAVAFPPIGKQTERFVRYVPGGNILDLKEKYQVKKHKDLQAALFTIRTVNVDKSIVRMRLLFKGASAHTVALKTMTSLPGQLLAVDFATNTKYMRRTAPKFLNIEKATHLLSADNANALFEVEGFPYFSRQQYLQLPAYDFDKHSFIIGASGSGKSKFISLYVDRLYRTSLKLNYRVVVIDPHDSIAEDFSGIEDSQVISFGKQDSTDLFPGAGTDLTSATELTATLFKSVLADQFNARLDRLLRYSLFVLMTAQAMSLENLKRFLADVEYRAQIVEHVQGFVPQNVIKFFGADYNEMRTQYYDSTVLPIVSMIEEMQLQPSLVGESETSLARTIQDNFLTVFSLNKVSMGEKVVKTVAGLLIQQIFLLAQAKAFNEKIILVIDEVSVVQNPTIAQILAEARKFNLTIVLTQQYFGQVEKDLRDAIFANVYNYYTFKVSEEDARALEGNLNMELPTEVVEAEHAKGIGEVELKVKLMTELHPRECLVRVLANGTMAPCLKARTVDAPSVGEARHVPKKLQQALPKKFKEGTPATAKQIRFSKEFLEQLADPDAVSPEALDARHQAVTTIPQRFGSLKDLLSTQSSSRAKIKKKDK